MDFVTHFYDNPAYPNNTYTVAHPTFDDHSRIIAISDIHGNLPYFRGLVEKLHLRADDSLVLLGDLVEKGPESLATLRYAMALREKCRVYPVLGNCDFWHLWVDGCDMEWDVRTFAHLLRQKATARSGLILEMCAELGEVLSPDTDLAALKALLREAFAPEFEYLRAMPFALESDKYIFVHGGIPHGETLESALCAEQPQVAIINPDLLGIRFTADDHVFCRYYDVEKGLVSESFFNAFWDNGELVAYNDYENGHKMVVQSIFAHGSYYYETEIDCPSWKLTVTSCELNEKTGELTVGYVYGSNDTKGTVKLPTRAE